VSTRTFEVVLRAAQRSGSSLWNAGMTKIHGRSHMPTKGRSRRFLGAENEPHGVKEFVTY
jgi:hypothetical protein